MKRPPFAASALLAPILGLIAYFAAVAVGLSAGRSQISGFVVAVVFGSLPFVRAQIAASGRTWDAALCAHVIVVSLLAFFLRSGVFVWLTSGWGWQGQGGLRPAR